MVLGRVQARRPAALRRECLGRRLTEGLRVILPLSTTSGRWQSKSPAGLCAPLSSCAAQKLRRSETAPLRNCAAQKLRRSETRCSVTALLQ